MNLLWNLFLAVLRSNNSAGARNTFLSLLLIRYTWTLPEAIPYRYRWSHVSLLFSCLSRDMVRVVTNNLLYLISFIVLSLLSLDAAQHGQVQAGKYFGHGTWGILGKCHIMAKINLFSLFFPSENSNFFSVETVDSCQLCVVFDWTWRSERLPLEKLKELLHNDYRRQG